MDGSGWEAMKWMFVFQACFEVLKEYESVDSIYCDNLYAEFFREWFLI